MLDIKVGVKANGRPVKLNQIAAMLNKIPRKKFDQVFSELVDIANDTRNEILLSMRNTRRQTTGYKRGTKTHFPSRPGSPPAIDRGELVASILASVNNTRKTVEVGATNRVEYARYLEKGTRKMKARPFLGPAFDKMNVKQRIINALNREV